MIFEVRNLSFSYYSSQLVINNASFTLSEGQILTILGPNGAGKSTLLNCLGNLASPSQGEIILNGSPMKSMKPKEVASVISYVQQSYESAFSYKVIDYVAMGMAPKVGVFSKPSREYSYLAYEMLETLEVSNLAAKPYTELSGGEKQIVTIARAMVQKPKVVLFDEPTSHLDYGNQIKILRLIKQMANQGCGIIITTHNPDHAILLEGTVALLDKDGLLETGSYEDIITSKRLQAVYDTELIITSVPEASRLACLTPNL